jgi:phosphoribosylformylglycinamidine synthase subunit PurQ / glutaminase
MTELNANTPHFIVLSGDGINCEKETGWAIEQAGGSAQIVHVNDLLENPSILKKANGLALPGGFSFGDELGSGRILGLKLKHSLGDALTEFVAKEKLVIGICNGFQVLTQLGLLPDYHNERSVSLGQNVSGKFLDRWVGLKSNQESVCVWTKGLKNLSLPVRHGEGRVVLTEGKEDIIYKQLKDNGQDCLYYDQDINGSFQQLAGLCDPSGRVLGLMPHPEAALFQHNVPGDQKSDDDGPGMALFKNAIEYIKGRK